MLMTNTDTKSARKVSAAAEKATNTAAEAATTTDAAFAYPKFEAPKFEVPEVFRAFAEQGMTQTREAYGRMKAVTEEATDMLEDSFDTTREGLREVQFKAIDAAKANTDATFDFVRKFMTVTSFADAVQLQTAFARERFEALVDYSKDMQATVTTLSTEAAKPAKVIFERALTQAKAA
jgi:phasin